MPLTTVHSPRLLWDQSPYLLTAGSTLRDDDMLYCQVALLTVWFQVLVVSCLLGHKPTLKGGSHSHPLHPQGPDGPHSGAYSRCLCMKNHQDRLCTGLFVPIPPSEQQAYPGSGSSRLHSSLSAQNTCVVSAPSTELSWTTAKWSHR